MLSSIPGKTQDQPSQKLSKPRTNTSSTNLLVATKSVTEPIPPFMPSDGDSVDGYFARMPLANGEPRSRRNTRSKIRSYFHVSSQGEAHSNSSEDEDASPNKIVYVARDVRRRLSRTNSSVLHNSSLDASAASSSSQLILGDHVSSDLDEHQALKEQIKEKVWTDTLAAQNHVPSPVDEDKHPDSVMSPIRRRSLYTPGIATRGEDILRKPPPPAQVSSQAAREYYYNPSLPESSPLSRLANLRSLQTGRSTPSELDYTHLGALKLGTLRVTNGAASPVPRDQNISPGLSPSPETTSQDGYHPLLEGGRHEPAVCSTEKSRSGNIPFTLQRKSLDVATSPISSASKAKAHHSCLEPMATAGNAPSDRHVSGQSTDNIKTSLHVRMPSGCKSIKRKPVPSPASTPQEDRAPGFLSRLPSDIHRSRTITSCEDNECRQAAFLKLTMNGTSPEVLDIDADKAQGHPTEVLLNKESSTIDSGYNSNVSLDSTECFATKANSETLLSSSPRQESPPKNPVTLPPPKPKERASDCRKTGSGENPVIRQSMTSQLSNDSSARIDSERTPEAASNAATPKMAFCVDRSGPNKMQKLQKKRPKSQPPLQRIPMSASLSSIEYEIPSVPVAIADLHSRRVSKFPIVDHTCTDIHQTDVEEIPPSAEPTAVQAHLEFPNHRSEDLPEQERPSFFQKLASKARSRSRSRPRVPLPSHDSDNESIKSICRSPSWSEYGSKRKEQKKKEKEERKLQKQLESQSANDSEIVGSRRRSRFRSRSRSRARSFQRNPGPTLTDFGTVKESLGASPYDIARITPGPQQQVPVKISQPHQLSTANPCVKSSVDVLESTDAHVRNRSRSLVGHENTFSHRGIPVTSARPCTMYVDRTVIPPMPPTRLAFTDSIPQTTFPPKDRLSERRNAPEQPKSTNEALGAPVYARGTKPTITAEELIDKLLDAPDPHSREVILEQIRQQKRGPVEGSGKGREEIGSHSAERTETKEPLFHPREGVASTSNRSVAPTSPRSPRIGTPNPDKVQANSHATEDYVVTSNELTDAPPMPPLPTIEYLQQQKKDKPVTECYTNHTPTPPQHQVLGTPKKDLWAGCTMQTERRKANGPSNEWDSPRLAWSQRRKSAGEALLLRDHLRSKDASDESSRFPVTTRAMTAGLQRVAEPKSSQKAFHKPWVSSPNQQLSASHSADSLQPKNQVAATTQAFERLTGRFEGGLMYGYEPGFGLGGSAGTRSTKTGATRKSVQMSQGFGVDLSDVPIFVAPSK
ncbi:MAG: hypothetical protein Q9219_000040 [cf. Caloplaca sp. 3 TL-2023]